MNWKPGCKSPGRPSGRTVLVGSARRASNQEGRSESELTKRRNRPPLRADYAGLSEKPRVSYVYPMASADAEERERARIGSPGVG